MTLGLGIFLSSLFLGVIFLSSLFLGVIYLFNWKKILFIWPLCIVLVVGVIGSVGFYIYNQYENKPKAYDTYLDIPLNATESDLYFLKGDEYIGKRYTKDMSRFSYTYEMHDNNYLYIRFKENKIWRISCYSDTEYECPSLNNIHIRDSATSVRKRLGEPDHILSSDDNIERIWAYEKFNIYIILSKGAVDSFGIFEPSLSIPEYQHNEYEFRDYINYKFSWTEKKLSIKEVPNLEDEEENNKINELLLEIISRSSDGDEVVWSEYVALKEKQDEAIRITIEEIKAAEKKKKAQQQAKAKELAKAKAKAREKAVATNIPSITKANTKWSQLKKGMAKYQVEKILGNPVRKEGSYWYYTEDRREGAHIYFSWNTGRGSNGSIYLQSTLVSI